MKTPILGVRRCRGKGGFTLIELMITGGLLAGVGLIFIFGSNFMLRSFANTMAINSSHLEAKSGVQQMLHTLHNGVSPTQLVDVTGSGSTRTVVPVASTQSAARGLAVQTVVGGPFPVAASAVAGATVISVLVNSQSGYIPVANDLIIIPTHGVEKYIESVGAYADAKYPINIRDSNGLSALEAISTATVTGSNPTHGIVLAYFTRPTVFLADNGELRQFDVGYVGAGSATTPRLTGNGRLITGGLAKTDPADSAKPFKPFNTPTLNATGSPEATRISAVNIATDDASVSNLGFAATNMFINSKIPTRMQFASRPTIRLSGSESN